MDLDYIDGLLLDDCWLETADGTVFLHPNLSSFGAYLDPLIGWPATEMNGDFNTNLITRSDQEEPWKMLTNEESPGRERVDVGQEECSGQSENDALERSELCRRLGMGAGEHLGSAPSVMERLMMAVGYIKDFVRDKDVLVQVWVPVSRGGRSVLITNQLPFSQNSSCTRLAKYRDVSVKYEFTADEDSKKALGLPGRVFLRKVPEWTPDVRFFRSDEYPRVDHAHEHDVRGTIALPVFEQGSKSCLGVIEVVMVTQQIKYGSEHEILCKALQAVKLRSSDVISPPNQKVFNRFNEAVLLEIRDTLRTACETHGLPLAQAWASCIQQSKEGCRHSDENYSCCVSTVDRACFVADPRIRDFHEACSEHHLLKGEGIVGMAFKSNEPCFSSDITSFCNTEYPLSHHAKLFGLHAAVALRLRCIFISKTDFVLEFFLPVDCRDPEEQRVLLTSLSTIIQYSCRNLRLVTDKECREENMEQLHPTSSLLASSVQNIRQCSGSVSLFQELNYDLNGVVEDSEECPTVGNGMGRTGEKRRTKVDKAITLEVLWQYFAGSLKDAAKSIGVCPTTLKRICRQHGIKRWPSRKIKKVGHSLQKLQLVIDSVNGASGAFQNSSLYSNLQELASRNVSGRVFSRKMGDGVKTSSDLGDAASKTAPSWLRQSSNSSQSLCRKEAGGEAQMGESLWKHPATGCVLQTAKESDQMRVKVSYGDERIRFRVQKWWRYEELVKEVGRRFNIRDMTKFDLKYLDDECEWVLLPTPTHAYLHQCFHVYKSSPLQTIKLLLHPSPRHNRLTC